MAKHRINTFKPAKKTRPQVHPQTIELTIESLADDGRGVGRHQNKVVFVSGALPTEVVTAKITRVHKRFDEAKLLELLETSADRHDPICEIYEQCGGCQLQHLQYTAQLKFKRNKLEKVLSANSPSTVSVAEISADDRAYRHRARLAYSDGVLGFKARASHDIVALERCPLLEDSLNTTLALSKAAIQGFFGDKARAEVSFTADRDGRVAILIRKDGYVDIKRCEELSARIVAPAFLHSVIGSKGPEWLGANSPLQFSTANAIVLRYQAGDFTQVNGSVNQQIVELCLKWLAPQTGERISDYFCGLGNFSLPLAKAGAEVMGFDAGEKMINSANQQALDYGLSASYFCADLFDDTAISIPANCRKVILDPPRAGAKALCEKIAAHKAVTHIVYVSCDPATLARDLAILRQAKFKIVEAAMADMFPHTYHVESAVLLQR